MPQATIIIDSNPETQKFWLRTIGELDWPILAENRLAIIDACQHRHANAQSVARACQQDPLLCWRVSRRANTIISDQDKWPNNIEHAIGLLGIPQLEKIATTAPVITLEGDPHHTLARQLLNSLAAQQLFNLLAAQINPKRLAKHSLSCLFYQLPKWAISINHPTRILESECLYHHDRQSSYSSEKQTLGCTISEICANLGQDLPMLSACKSSWSRLNTPLYRDLKVAANNFQKRIKSGIQQNHLSPELLIIFCHKLVESQGHPQKFRQVIRFLSGVSGRNRESLQHAFSQAMLSTPRPKDLAIELHPMRKLLCFWQDSRWLPKPIISAAENPDTGTDTGISLKQVEQDAFANSALKQCIRNMLSQQFDSFSQLFRFVGQSLEQGFSHSQGCVLVRTGKQLQCAYQHGLDNEILKRSGIDLENRAEDVIYKLMRKAGSIQFQIKPDRLPNELIPPFSPEKYINISSIHIGTRGTALLLLQSRQPLSDDCWRQFKQLGHSFQHCLLGLMRKKK